MAIVPDNLSITYLPIYYILTLSNPFTVMQSYDLGIYNYNASSAKLAERFSKKKKIFVCLQNALGY
jgi:hypothetical protein